MNKKAVKYSVYIVLGLLFSYYAWLRYDNSLLIPAPRASFGDTRDYFFVASPPLFSRDFWMSNRAPILPLFYKLLGTDHNEILTFQLWFSIFSWGTLALALTRTTKNVFLKPFYFVVILTFSLSQEIIMWDYLILSDSISVSLMALFLASSVLLLEKWDVFKILFLFATSLLLAGIRDTFAYWLLMIGGSLPILLFFTKNQARRIFLVSGFFILVFLASNFSASSGARWYFPVLNTIGIRILPNEQHTTYLEGLGMPVSDTLLERQGKPLHADSLAMMKASDLQAFRDWVKSDGKQAYMKFLWFYKAYSLQGWTKDMGTLLNPDVYYYSATGFKDIIEDLRLDEFVYPDRFGILFFFIVNYLAVGATVWVFYEQRGVSLMWILPLLLILLSFPQVLLIWNADANDMARHSLYHNIQLRLGFWILILFGLDFLLNQIKTMRLQQQ